MVNFELTVVKMTIKERSPVWVAEELGRRVRRLRLEQGWTQDELAERAGVGLSTLKKFEASGQGTLARFLRLAAVLGVIEECSKLFSESHTLESLDAISRRQRQRAPRRKKEDPE